jgi:hypothetical protein
MNELFRKPNRQERIEICKAERALYVTRLLDLGQKMSDIERDPAVDLNREFPESYILLLDQRDELARYDEDLRDEIEVLSIEERNLNSARQEIQTHRAAAIRGLEEVREMAPGLKAVADCSRYRSEIRRAENKLRIINRMIMSID